MSGKLPGGNEEELKLVTYCGLCCGLCAQRAGIPLRARALRESLSKEGYELWAKEIAGFNEFWAFLSDLCDPEKCCPGCRQGGGYPLCSIRKCAGERKVAICVLCEEYPCKRVLELAERYPILLSDGKRMRRIGVKSWIREQEERAKTGFTYADIRCDARREADA